MYEFCWFFLIYSFLGWCSEVSLEALKSSKFVNRGFLNGPICPIYGFGAVIVILLLTPFKSNIFILYVFSVFLTSLLEYITGFVLEKFFHQKWWDYAEEKFNLHGYICLFFSLLWGVACVAAMYILHPAISYIVSAIPLLLGNILLAFLLCIVLIDCVATVSAIYNLRRKLKQFDDIASKINALTSEIGQLISDGVIELADRKDILDEAIRKTQDSFDETVRKTQATLDETIRKTQATLDETVRKKQTLLAELTGSAEEILKTHIFGEKRLLKAFPKLTLISYTDAMKHLKAFISSKKSDRNQ